MLFRSAVLSEVASGVMNTKTKGKVSLNLEIEPFDENRVKIKHKLSYVRPTTGTEFQLVGTHQRVFFNKKVHCIAQ